MIPEHIAKIIKAACKCGERGWVCHSCQWLKENEEKDMPQQFPLIEKWMPGLKVWTTVGTVDTLAGNPTDLVIPLPDLEAELAKGQQVKAYPDHDGWQDLNVLSKTSQPDMEALAIGARPIKQETAEDLLRAIVEERSDHGTYPNSPLHRARAFLARSKA